MGCAGSESSDLLCCKYFCELFLEELVCAVNVFDYNCRLRFETTAASGCEIWWSPAQEGYPLVAFTKYAEVRRDEFRRFSRTSFVDGFGEQGLADTGLSDDHKGLSTGREVRDSRLDSGDRGTAAYDLDGIQSSGPGVGD